jgi:hypothetical protein
MWAGGGTAGNPGGAAGQGAQAQQQSADEEVLKTRINTLEEENQSLRALLNSLMGDRQSLLNRSDSSAAEIQKLRQVTSPLLRLRPNGGAPGSRCRANVAHIRQSRTDSGLGFQVTVLQIFQVVPSSLALALRVCAPRFLRK